MRTNKNTQCTTSLGCAHILQPAQWVRHGAHSLSVVLGPEQTLKWPLPSVPLLPCLIHSWLEPLMADSLMAGTSALWFLASTPSLCWSHMSLAEGLWRPSQKFIHKDNHHISLCMASWAPFTQSFLCHHLPCPSFVLRAGTHWDTGRVLWPNMHILAKSIR